MRINTTFSKDSSDCIATLSSLTECIQFLVTIPVPPPEEGEETPPTNLVRHMTVNVAELRTMLSWTDDLFGHPLADLDILLQVCICWYTNIHTSTVHQVVFPLRERARRAKLRRRKITTRGSTTYLVLTPAFYFLFYGRLYCPVLWCWICERDM